MADGARLFVGVRVSVTTANALGGAAETLERRARDAGVDIRWVAPVNYHVTLKFLGWTRVETLGPLRDGLAGAVAGMSRFSFRTARLGGFPSLEKTNVVWAGVEGEGFVELATRIEAVTTPLGFAADNRAFHAHVTLGRVRETRAVREVVLPLAEQMFGETSVDSVTLFESEIKSSCSVYRELHRFGFKVAVSTPERQTRAVDLGAAERSTDPDDTEDGWPRGHHPDR
jgi:2'-5' RNA ligase